MIRLGSMCTGYGGLDLGVEAALGPVSLQWVADPDPGASRILAHRFPDVPNLGDIRTFPWESAAPVDVLTAGFPCQPVSMAGRRAGTSDERWLFDDICDAIGRMVTRPRLLVFENVRGLLTANRGHAMARVVHGLAALGYVGSWRTLRASTIGAPHRRERVFIVARLADAQGPRLQGPRILGPAPQHHRDAPTDPTHLGHHRAGRARDRRTGPENRGHPATNTTSDRRKQRRAEPAGEQRRPDAPERRHPAPHPDRPGRETLGGRPGTGDERRPQPLVGRFEDWGPYTDAITRWEHVTGHVAPAPTEPTGRDGAHRLAPQFVEWMMGLTPGWVTDTPGLSRTAQLTALGNGVVWPQAAAALADLLHDGPELSHP